ncbi:hypothetical protein QFC21_006570 [Naganishia friedmannii]|uniref:Uncharacterized protein n=1 Tax=Naganishia friedmannii TaxID=89922 RepID=A0ACC2V2K1_9TREE|nr:hypothetical protein QFC21_006570 [Naganishia friedmannii]
MSSSDASLASIHPHLRALATRADRTRDQVARLVQLLGSDPLNDPTRMSMFPWSVFLEHYNTVTHQLADLSSYLSTPNTPISSLFIHPAHALTQTDQTAFYGGQFAVHDPPLRPIPGKPYTDAREEGYKEFAEGVQSLVAEKLKALSGKEKEEGVFDEGLKAEYQALLERSKIFLESDEHVNLSLLEPSNTSHQTLDQSLSHARSLLDNLQQRQGKAQAAVGGLRHGFEWGMRLDKGWSEKAEAEAGASKSLAEEEEEDDDDEDGSGEDDDEDEEMEQVPTPAAITPAQAQPSNTSTSAVVAEVSALSSSSASPPPISNTASIPPATNTTAQTGQQEVIDLLGDDDDDDLFGDNSSTATPGGVATPGSGGTQPGQEQGDSDEDEEMDQVA